VVFDLQYSGWDLGITEQVCDQGALKVGDADAAGQALPSQAFHCGPGLLDGGVAEVVLIALVFPARWVAMFRVNEFEGDGKVDVEQVKVLEAPVGELFPADGFDGVLFVERIPQLGDDEELLSLDQAVFDGARDAFSSFYFVAIIARAVEESIARLDGIVDGIGTGGIVDLPQAEAYLWHIIATVQLDLGSGRHDYLIVRVFFPE